MTLWWLRMQAPQRHPTDHTQARSAWAWLILPLLTVHTVDSVDSDQRIELCHTAYGASEHGTPTERTPTQTYYPGRLNVLAGTDSHLPPMPILEHLSLATHWWSPSIHILYKLYLYCLVCNASGRSIICCDYILEIWWLHSLIIVKRLMAAERKHGRQISSPGCTANKGQSKRTHPLYLLFHSGCSINSQL